MSTTRASRMLLAASAEDVGDVKLSQPAAEVVADLVRLL
jgi:hypothetical protein